MNYILLSIAVVLLSFLYEKVKKDKTLARLVLMVMCLLLAWFAGSRTSYNDTYAYRYEFLKTGNNIAYVFKGAFSISNVYLYNLWRFIIRNYITSNVHIYFFLSSLLFVVPSVRLICKYSENVVFSMFLFVWCGMYLFSLAGLKQSMATGLFLLSIPSLIEKKYVKYYLYNFFGIWFHTYSIVLWVVPLLGRKLFNKITFWFSFFLIVLGINLNLFSGWISSILEVIGKEVDETTIVSGSVNLYRALVFLVPIFLMIIGRHKLEEQIKESDNLFLKIALLSGLFMFLALFGNPILFGRIPQYFYIGIIIGLPYLIRVVFNKRDTKLVFLASVVLFAIYGFYGIYVDKILSRDVFGMEYWWF